MIHQHPVGLGRIVAMPPFWQSASESWERFPEKQALPVVQQPSYLRLQGLGIQPVTALKLDLRLDLAHDTPYHGGQLLNGKIYLITKQDQVYYGSPNALKKLAVTSATRTKCINQQERTFNTEEGLFFRVSNRNGKQTAIVSVPWLCGLRFKMPHLRQSHFTQAFS